MELYLAICSETNNVKMFTGYEEFKEFAVKNRYSHDYYRIGAIEQVMDVDLFYYD